MTYKLLVVSRCDGRRTFKFITTSVPTHHSATVPWTVPARRRTKNSAKRVDSICTSEDRSTLCVARWRQELGPFGTSAPYDGLSATTSTLRACDTPAAQRVSVHGSTLGFGFAFGGWAAPLGHNARLANRATEFGLGHAAFSACASCTAQLEECAPAHD